MLELYEKYFRSMPCYVTVQDRELTIIDANTKFKEDFGDWNGRHCYQIFKQRSELCDVCPVERTFRDGLPHVSQETVYSLDGRDVAVIVYTTPIRDDSGEIISVMGMSADITEVKLLEERLRDSQERYRLLFDQVPCFISIQDKDLNIIEANRRFTQAFGANLGCKCHEIYKHRQEECLICPVQETFQDGKVHRSEELVTSRDGRQINTLVYTAPIRDALGDIRGVMEMSADITPVRELQTQLESIGLLISSVSHGIKGLLNGLDGGMYLVNSGMAKGNQERLEKGWEMVQRNVERIRSQVLNILYYAKEREPNWETVSASGLAEEILTMTEPQATELGVTLEKDVDPGAGNFEADPQAMRSLLLNLMENSLDACRVDNSKSEHKVRLSAKGGDDHIRFEIEDNGIGMDQETRDKAFSLFFSSKGAEGTGLGLFIAHKITTAHGGEITLESEPDRGSKFIVSIPTKHEELQAQATEG